MVRVVGRVKRAFEAAGHGQAPIHDDDILAAVTNHSVLEGGDRHGFATTAHRVRLAVRVRNALDVHGHPAPDIDDLTAALQGTLPTIF